MTKIAPVVYLKNAIPEDSWSWVLPALRQDPLIWNCLQDEDFLQRAVRQIGTNPKRWSPMNLSLVSLGVDLNIEELGTTPLETLSPYLHKQAAKAYENHISDSPPAVDLKQAGLLALYYAEHPTEAKLVGSKTSLACLVSLQSDPVEILSKLSPCAAVHSILAKPLPPDEQIKFISECLEMRDAGSKLAFLTQLSSQRPKIAAMVARQLLENSPIPSAALEISGTGNFALPTLANLLVEVALFEISDQVDEYIAQTSLAHKKAGEIQADLAARLLKQDIRDDKIEKAHDRWQQIKDQVLPNQAARICLTLIDQGYHTEAKRWFKDILPNDAGTDPEVDLAQGFLNHLKNDAEGTRSRVNKTLAGYTQADDPDLLHLRMLARLSLDSNLPLEAQKAIKLAMKNHPNDVQLVSLLRESQQAAGQAEEAIQAAHLAVALEPENVDLHRQLAGALESAGKWLQAMQARGVILARHESLESEAAYKDAYHFAVSSLKSNRPQSTASVCQKLLKMKPEDADAHLLLGEAYVAMGDFYKAQARFTEATQLAPGSAKSWLSLAGIYRDTDQPAKQCEILQAASNVVTQDAQIFLALGEVYLRDDAPTRALNSFRTANELAKKNAQSTPKHIKSEAALALGNTLHQLGHDKDARLVLAEAYEADRDHMAIAHAYARVLLDTEAPERALPILDQTRKNVSEDELDIHLDYAKACLATKSNLDETRETLNRILVAHPDHAEARVFLAEVLTESQDLEAAQEVYQEALGIVLQEDHSLSTRIALGLSKVYLGLNQPENAIATLKNVLQVNGEDLEVLKTLSTAYHAANLREKAIWAAKSVLEITPDSEDNLDWFIQQSIELGATHKAIEVLEKMFDQEDKQGSRLTKLGWLYLYDGDIQTARNKFTQIKTLDEVSPHDLYKSSQGLLTLEEANTAADFLEKAIQICKTSGEKDLLPKLYTSKIQAHQMNLDHNQALHTVDEAIAFSPGNPALIQKKAEILLDLDSHQEAVTCIESAMEKFPKNPNLKLQAAIIHRADGDLAAASNYAKQALKSFHTSETEMLDARASAIIADLADAMLQTDAARDVLNEAAVIQEHPLPGSIQYHCLRAELALDTGGEFEAADALTDLLDERLNHPRVLALQSRLTARKGDTQTASQIFQKALKSIGGFTPFRSHQAEEEGSEALSQTEHTASTYIALAEAGLALKEWSVAAFLLKKAVALAPAEPRSHFKYARALVLRAEYQHLCETLNVTKHAPGESAKARYAFKEFEHSILQAAQLITKMTQSNQGEDLNDNGARDYISTWLARGQAAFQPSHEHAKALAKLPKTAENLTAQLAGFRHSGELEEASTLAQQIYGTMSQVKVHPYLLGQIALALAGKEPTLAQDAIQTAIEVSRWKNMPDCAIFNAIAAVTAQKRNDRDLQVASLQEALEIWPDEPKWLSTAADLYLESDQTEKIQKSIQLLEQAAQLEPNQVEHYLKLSAAHQRLSNLKGAIVVLDQATRVLPRQPEPWLALAKAHQAKGEIPQATRCAKALVQIDPDQPDGQILLAEVSLEVNNAKKAADHINDVLERHPDHPQALLLRAKTYMKLKDPKAALESLEKVLPKLPKSIPMQLQRIQLLQETKGASVALESLSQLSEENPEDPRIYAALAELYSNLNDPKNAIQNAQLALKVEKEGLDKQEHISILTLLGRLLRKTGQLDQAIHYLNDAVEKGSEDPTSYIELGRCFQEQRLYDRALQYFEKAIEQAPEDSQAYYHAGLVLKETKEYRGAETMFKKAAKLAPKNMHIYRQLAAVTAINIVQSHQSKPEAGTPISIDVPTESIEK